MRSRGSTARHGIASRRAEAALEFGHSLQAQIGGQLAAGFVLLDLYEDWWDDETTPLNRFMPTTLATRARKARTAPETEGRR